MQESFSELAVKVDRQGQRQEAMETYIHRKQKSRPSVWASPSPSRVKFESDIPAYPKSSVPIELEDDEVPEGFQPFLKKATSAFATKSREECTTTWKALNRHAVKSENEEAQQALFAIAQKSANLNVFRNQLQIYVHGNQMTEEQIAKLERPQRVSRSKQPLRRNASSARSSNTKGKRLF